MKPMKPPSPGIRGRLRTCLLFAVVIPFALWANLDMIKQEMHKLHRTGHFLDERMYESRLEPLGQMLPRDAVVGYVTDDDANVGHRTTYLFLTQYDLCPVLVAEGRNYPYVIGGYYGLDNPRMQGTMGLTLVKDFGYGILLYRGPQR